MKTLDLKHMEDVNGGMSCGWAIGGMVLAAGVFTFGTGGLGSLLVNAAGLGYGFYGYVESCFGNELT